MRPFFVLISAKRDDYDRLKWIVIGNKIGVSIADLQSIL